MDPRGDTIESRRDVEGVYGRYRPIAGDFSALVEALSRPLDPVVWANPSRLDRDSLASILVTSGMKSSPLSWEPSALRLHDVDRPGLGWAHGAGLYYVQEEASLVPARLLDAQPGERVLDLCAAPGSKTARIALAMENRGTLVANDRSVQRMAAVSAAIARLGLFNVTCTVGDGTTYPLEAGPFDRILVDAPCSAEGNGAKNASWRAPDPDFRAWVCGQQRALLRRASRMCRAGGRIIYSTCTLAPEENELVIDTVIRELGGALAVVPFDPIEGLTMSAPLESWAGHTFIDEVRHARRLWPHVSGTGGFFVAVLEKRAPSESAGPGAPARDLGSDPQRDVSLARFSDAFGFDARIFEGLTLLSSGRNARLVSDDHVIPTGARLVSTGLPVMRNKVHSAKLSTAGALAFGPRGSRRVIELDLREAAAFQARDPNVLDPSRVDVDRGYVIARTAGHALGMGMLRADEGGLVLTSEYPTAWSRTSRSGRA